MLALIVAVMLQQAQPGQVVWSTPPEPVVEAPVAPPPSIPAWARADPYGYERSECSPLIRKAAESMEACQSRVRTTLAAHLGSALPAGLTPGDTGAAENCRQVAGADGRYAMQCSAPIRDSRGVPAPEERRCESKPVVLPGGGTAFNQVCEPRTGQEDGGLRIRLGGND